METDVLDGSFTFEERFYRPGYFRGDYRLTSNRDCLFIHADKDPKMWKLAGVLRVTCVVNGRKPVHDVRLANVGHWPEWMVRKFNDIKRKARRATAAAYLAKLEREVLDMCQHPCVEESFRSLEFVVKQRLEAFGAHYGQPLQPVT